MKGGFGNAGLMTHRYIQVDKREKAGEKIIGKYGFKRPQKRQTTDSTINVSHLDQSIDTLVEQGKATKRQSMYTVDLSELGYDKLLSQGAVTRKMKVTVGAASESAMAKIKKAGGQVTLLSEVEAEV